MKTIVTMTFILDEEIIDYLIKHQKMDNKTKEKHLILVNGKYYKLHSIPDSLQIFPREKQLIRLELEP